MDFLQRVGAEISLTDQLLYTDHYSFPLRGREQGVSDVQRLINAGQMNSLSHDREEDESVEDWEGTVELAGTVTLPPLSGRTARCRVVRCGDSMVVNKVPRCNEVVSHAFHHVFVTSRCTAFPAWKSCYFPQESPEYPLKGGVGYLSGK
jgi:hypothetical protein